MVTLRQTLLLASMLAAVGCTSSGEIGTQGREVSARDARTLHGEMAEGSVWLHREVNTTEAEIYLQRELGEYWTRDSEIYTLWTQLKLKRASTDRLWVYSTTANPRWASGGGRGLALERAGKVILVLPVSSSR